MERSKTWRGENEGTRTLASFLMGLGASFTTTGSAPAFLIPSVWMEMGLPHPCPPPRTSEHLQALAWGKGQHQHPPRAQRGCWATSTPLLLHLRIPWCQDSPWAQARLLPALHSPCGLAPRTARCWGAGAVVPQRAGNDHDNTSGCPGAGLCCCSALLKRVGVRLPLGRSDFSGSVV